MMDDSKLATLVETICTALNIAAELGIDIKPEMDEVARKVLKVSNKMHGEFRASLRHLRFATHSKTVQ
jgi:hypothetical protein